MHVRKTVQIGDRSITLDFNKFAKQSSGSVMVSSGGTQVLVTVCAADKPTPGIDFVPLGIDYIEKHYAAGKVPGGYLKREGKPSEYATLTARVIDRPLRPCFPKNYRNETVVTATVVSYEHGYSPAPLALFGASCALTMSEIPFEGPVASLRLGMKDGEYIIDPFEGDDENLDLDLNIACKPDSVLMVEAGAKFLSEEQMLEAINYAHKTMEPLFEIQKEIREELGKEKMALELQEVNSDLQSKVEEHASPLLEEAYKISEKKKRSLALGDCLDQLKKEHNSSEDPTLNKEIETIFDKLKFNYLRNKIVETGYRIDGRSSTEIRPITCEVGVLNRPHGSSLFTRGETQSLGVVTLAAPEDMQRADNLWAVDDKERFMLHYNFPPFSVGEARMQRSPGRREVGHGNLARRALLPVIPDEQSFSYTIRVVSETLESNGSSSMAAVCSGTMAMLQAGVPLKDSVAGIAMGLIKQGEKYTVLSDILGDEDHLGDMDFKVCGSQNGITALQMDNKIAGITSEILKEALYQAKEGRIHILSKINDTISEPQAMNQMTPKIFKIKISVDKIKDLIGPGGKNIKRITSETGAKVNIEDPGIIHIMAPDLTSAQAAKSMVRAYTAQPKNGDIYLATVTKVTEFGFYAEIKPNLEGFCHITQFDKEQVDSLTDHVKADQEILVKIVDIDKQFRIKLSRKEALGQKPTFSRKL